MTDKATLRDKTTAHVRALLMSVPVQLTVHELKRDYFNFIGEQLRYRDMGFATIEDYIRDIEDAVQIGWKNGLMTLSAKPDEATKHIQSLVSRQKRDPKKKYAVLQKGGPRYQRQGASSYRTQGPPQPPPLVSGYVQGQIKQLLRCHTDGLPLTHFNSVFSRKYGNGLNFRRFGFDSLYSLLYSLKDSVRIQELQGGERWVTAVDIPRFSAAPQPTTRSHVIDEARVQAPPQTRSRLSDESTGQKRPSKGRGRRRENSGDINTTSLGSTESRDSSENLEQYQDSETRMKMQIRKILEKYPDGLWARQLPTVYTQQYGKHLDFREQGYLSVVDFVAAFPDIVRLDRPNPKSDWMLFDARLPVPQVQERAESQRDQHRSGATLDETKDSIRKVLEMMPDGIPVATFPQVFQELSGSHLPVKELGFDTPEDLFISLADSVLQLVFRSSSGFLVFPADADIEDEKMEDEVAEVPLPAEVPDCPAGAVGPGVHYTPVLPPEPEGYVEVFVSNISSPGLFWLQIRRKDTTLALENLMDNLDFFYNSDSSRDYIIPQSLIAPGLVCAAIFPEDQNWHRGVITGSNKEGFIQVYYVDYGNTNFVDKSSIRFLKLDYLKLPAQALQARLASIAPKDKVWKSSAKSKMLKLCINKPLIAYITAVVDRILSVKLMNTSCKSPEDIFINNALLHHGHGFLYRPDTAADLLASQFNLGEEQVLSVCLTDTNSSEDIHINDLLVHDGYAIFCPDTDESLHAADSNLPEVPDYGHVYGWTTNREAPRLPAAAESKDDNTANRGFVKWVQLTKSHVIHMINLDGVAYIVSAEISGLIWDEDILSSMLKKKHIDAPKVIITSEDHPKVFEDLRRFKVKSLTSELHGRKQFVSLYTLDSVPTILKVFEHPSMELIKAVEELIARFDPKSPYWKGSSGEGTEASSVTAPSVSAPSVDESLEELEEPEETVTSREGKHIALQSLQFKRKRILQNLMSDPSRTVEIVTELNNCEVEIRMLKDEIETQSQIDSKNSSFSMDAEKTTVPKAQTNVKKPTPQPTVKLETVKVSAISGPTGLKTPEKLITDNETYVKNILASATKPSAAAHIVTKPSVTVETSPTTSLPQFTNLSNQSAYRLPQMTATSQQLHPFLMQQRMQNMNQFNIASGNQLVGHNAGGMGGMNPFMMQQRMLAPAMMAQQGGMMPPQMMPQQQFPGQCPGLLPAVNPLMYQTMTNAGDASMQTMPQLQMAGVGGVTRGQPPMGRGQMVRPENMGLLPGLMPLLQNLSMGRGNPQGKKN